MKADNIYKILVSLIILTFFSCLLIPLHAQTFDTKGTDFLLTFLPNYHLGEADSVYIFVSIEKATNLRLTFSRVGKPDEIISATLPKADSMYKFAFPYYLYELGNGSAGSNGVDNEEKPAKVSARISADNEINVYGLSLATRSSDAFMVLPTDVLNKEYYILAYRADSVKDEYYTPSQFAIVANEDDTKILITPAAKTKLNRAAGIPFAVTLNRGESYLVSSSHSGGTLDDLSGTYLSGDKPFAVFAGQQRVAVPAEMRDYFLKSDDNINPSLDFICSQIPPVATWGKNAFVIPFPEVANLLEADKFHDKYRVLSASDGNVVDVNGYKHMLNRGEWFEDNILNSPLNINASAPILVAQYKRSSCANISDALFLIIPPKEQFITSATLMNMDRKNAGNSTFARQYIFTVCPDSALNSCKIDGKMLTAASFVKIPQSGYSYLISDVQSGTHSFSSNAKCGLYVVGYGTAISYGYLGGMMMGIINDNTGNSDTIPYVTEKSSGCFNRIYSVSHEIPSNNISVIKERTNNVTVNISQDIYGSGATILSIALEDNSRDGFYAVKLIDAADNFRILSDTIQGNTLSAYFDSDPGNPDTVQIGGQKCSEFILKNSGILPWHIEGGLCFRKGINFSIPLSQFPMTIPPLDSQSVTFCAFPLECPEQEEILFDTLDLNFGCSETHLPVSVIPQKIMEYGNSKCGLPLTLTISSIADSLVFDEIKINSIRKTAALIYGLPYAGNFDISIFDISGNYLGNIYKGSGKAGFYEFDYDYSDLPDGLCFVRISHPAGIITRKMLIVK